MQLPGQKLVNLKKKKHNVESCELSFIGGNMRTAAQETALQIAPRDCSKEVVGKGSIYVILIKREHMQSSTYYFGENFCCSHEASASHRNNHHHEGC